LEVELTPHEKISFQKSVTAVKSLVEAMARFTA
jgi:hypothetical protein